MGIAGSCSKCGRLLMGEDLKKARKTDCIVERFGMKLNGWSLTCDPCVQKEKGDD